MILFKFNVSLDFQDGFGFVDNEIKSVYISHSCDKMLLKLYINTRQQNQFIPLHYFNLESNLKQH